VRAKFAQNVQQPLIQRVDVRHADRHLCAISPGKTPEQWSYSSTSRQTRLQGGAAVPRSSVSGGVESEILVSLDPERMQAAGLTAVNVSQSLAHNVDLAGGAPNRQERQGSDAGRRQDVEDLAGT